MFGTFLEPKTVKNPSKEDLLGYALGALDANQQLLVQQSIDQDANIEEQLIEIKASLAPLELLEGGSGARPGLARRTCEMLATVQKEARRESTASPLSEPLALPVEAMPGSSVMSPSTRSEFSRGVFEL